MGAYPNYGPELPGWIPRAVHDYLIHTLSGRSIRALARDAGCEPSTISRRVRHIENRRDDPLVDSALLRLGRTTDTPTANGATRTGHMTMQSSVRTEIPGDEEIESEARRVLRRLAEQGACLALAPAMETAVVVRETGDGPAVRTAVVDKMIAEALALRTWIDGGGEGRVLRYRITPAGRAELKRLVAKEESRRAAEQGRGMADTMDDPGKAPGNGPGTRSQKSTRYSMTESPLLALARRRDRDGKVFLSQDLVAAGERLREDFELARLSGKAPKSWEDVPAVGRAAEAILDPSDTGPDAACARVELALAALGPGLGDVALRCCCFLEGLEATEQRMGWSARSGKIVLRIALQRLKRHFDSSSEHWSPMIGVATK